MLTTACSGGLAFPPARKLKCARPVAGWAQSSIGPRGKVSRTTLADANERHYWRIYPDYAQVLIGIARPLYARDPIGVDLDQRLYALDSTTVDLCLTLFPWAKFRRHTAAVKVHTLLDLHGNIPTFISITDGKVHDVNILGEILPETGSFYVMDRGYVDFERLYVSTLTGGEIFKTWLVMQLVGTKTTHFLRMWGWHVDYTIEADAANRLGIAFDGEEIRPTGDGAVLDGQSGKNLFRNEFKTDPGDHRLARLRTKGFCRKLTEGTHLTTSEASFPRVWLPKHGGFECPECGSLLFQI